MNDTSTLVASFVLITVISFLIHWLVKPRTIEGSLALGVVNGLFLGVLFFVILGVGR